MTEGNDSGEKHKVVVERGSLLTWSKPGVQIKRNLYYEDRPSNKLTIIGSGSEEDPFSLPVGADLIQNINLIFDWCNQEKVKGDNLADNVFHFKHNNGLFAFNFNQDAPDLIEINRAPSGYDKEDFYKKLNDTLGL